MAQFCRLWPQDCLETTSTIFKQIVSRHKLTEDITGRMKSHERACEEARTAFDRLSPLSGCNQDMRRRVGDDLKDQKKKKKKETKINVACIRLSTGRDSLSLLCVHNETRNFIQIKTLKIKTLILSKRWSYLNIDLIKTLIISKRTNPQRKSCSKVRHLVELFETMSMVALSILC